jgi:hypothetical protein
MYSIWVSGSGGNSTINPCDFTTGGYCWPSYPTLAEIKEIVKEAVREALAEPLKEGITPEEALEVLKDAIA